MKNSWRAGAVVVAALGLVATGCSSNTSTTTKASSGSATAGAPGTGGKAVGFIFVGPKDDYGYNQAAYEGSQDVAKAFPNLKVLTAENVPEDDNATRVMEGMINNGAKIIFATSYGHLDPAMKVAAAHPDVVVIQQGNIATGAFTVGYHADASTLAPKGWLTGSQWKWGPLYVDVVRTAIDGKFAGSKYNANYRVGLKTGDNPFVQSPYGPSVSAETKADIDKA